MFEQLYLEGGSVLHNLDFWTKVLCLLILVPVAAFVASVWVLMLVSLYVLLLIVLSKVGPGTFWKHVRLYYLLLTVAIMTLSLVFSPGDLSARAVLGIALSVRFAVLTSLGILFSMITDPMEIPIGLLRAKAPHRYGVVMMAAFRMMPLIASKVTTVVEVQRARGARFSLSLRALPRLASELTSLVVPLVYATLETSIALSDTLLARGYDPDARSITVPPASVGKRDIAIAVVSTALLLLSATSY